MSNYHDLMVSALETGLEIGFASNKIVGIIGAMDIEVNGIIRAMTERTDKTISGIKFISGKIGDKSVVVAKCGVGKVFAAICAQTMILEYKPTAIINIGVAGALTKDLAVMDVVLGTEVLQHDMDTSALGDPKGFISGINVTNIKADRDITASLEKAAKEVGCNVFKGIIASGDKFISNKKEKDLLNKQFNAIACEMEGAAIGHVCYVNKVPFAVLRAISDGEGAAMDYLTFSDKAAEQSIGVIKKFFEQK